MTQPLAPARAGLLVLPGPGEEPGGRHELRLPGTPWSVRTAGWPGGRPFAEVYAAGALLDVVVFTPLSAAILRGACRAAPGGQPQALAWGRLPAAGDPQAQAVMAADGGPGPVTVEFSRPGLRPQPHRAEVTGVGRWFWLAAADGRFTAVTVTHPRGRQRRRVRGVRL